jgi:uncharacterized membrane protein YgcG
LLDANQILPVCVQSLWFDQVIQSQASLLASYWVSVDGSLPLASTGRGGEAGVSRGVTQGGGSEGGGGG